MKISSQRSDQCWINLRLCTIAKRKFREYFLARKFARRDIRAKYLKWNVEVAISVEINCSTRSNEYLTINNAPLISGMTKYGKRVTVENRNEDGLKIK